MINLNINKNLKQFKQTIFLFHGVISNHKNKIIRWLLVSLFMCQRELITLPNKKIFFNKSKTSALAFRYVGLIKLERFVIEVSFLEYIYDLFLSEKKEIYHFNFYHIRKLKIPFGKLS